MVRNVTLTIDHKSVTVPENTTILEAARSVNINPVPQKDFLSGTLLQCGSAYAHIFYMKM